MEVYWNALQAMQQLDAILPLDFSSDIYVAARSTADPRSDVNFAGTLRAELLRVRKSVGKVYGMSGSAHGPIPAPGDGRWIAV